MHFSFFKILLVLLYLLSPTSVYSIEPPKLKNLVLHKEPKKLENVEFKNINLASRRPALRLIVWH